MIHKYHKENWIQYAIKRPGDFTRKAKKAGMSVSEYVSKALSKKSKVSKRTKKQAILAKTLKKLAKRK